MSSGYWLLSDEALHDRAWRKLRGPSLRALAPAAPADLPPTLTIENGVATIKVDGVLTPEPDYYGEANTTYPDLQDALAAALAEPKVKQIEWMIDSPGGAVDGFFGLIEDIAAARASAKPKPMRAIAKNAQSAAYGIAAAVGHITATSRMSAIGSVGVAIDSFVLGDLIGKVVHLTNTDAPKKRPEIGTPEGRAVVVEYLDQVAQEFMGAIAKGRSVPVGKVASDFGRGASMLAERALAAGMIDAIAVRVGGVRTDLTYARTQDTVPNCMATEPTPSPAPEEAKPETAEPTLAPVDEAEAAPESEDEPAPAPADAPTASAVAAAVVALPGLTDAERAELTAFRAERDARETAERRALITDLVALGAETPAHAWVNNAPAPRLAAEPIDSLRARTEALRTQRAASPELRPPAGANNEYLLTDFERADAAKIKDPEKRAVFVARRLARKQKAL